MPSLIQTIEAKYIKPQIVNVNTGDTVKVHQKIKEAGKERIQIFEGMVIRTDRKKSLTASITVRRIASGVGVEKNYMLHSPNVLKVEVVKRSKVRRNYLSYMRVRTGKSTRLTGVDFDKKAVNAIHDVQAEAEEEKLHEEATAAHEEEEKAAETKEAKEARKLEEALAAHEAVTQEVVESEKLKKQ
ncbi:MAG TPA: 50S ribosomal protein L19 [Patescibacteria group bacterium]|nr:50S ribosomal protein L19 [Patescibacteria group bacterium]